VTATARTGRLGEDRERALLRLQQPALAGLRPEPGPSLSERLDELESAGPRVLPSLDDED
jgi:hypothetical protein